MLDKIKRRLPGSEKATATLFALKDLINSRFLPPMDRLILKRIIVNYFLGEVADKTYNLKIYKELEKNYTENDYFNFRGIKFPKVNTTEEEIVFITECLDIIYSLFTTRYIIDEGPYLYKKVCINQGDIVIDAGANLGLFSALASHLGAIVYAFEPVEEIRNNYLKQTAQLNSNINIIPLALSNKAGVIEINIDLNNLGGSSFVLSRGQSKKEIISTVTIDEWVKENNIPRVDFIKADIEGAERLMLEGAQWVLKTYAPKLAICTYHLSNDKEVLTKLILQANPNYKIEYRWKKLYASIKS